MKDIIHIKPLTVKSMGRSHLACLRCRSQKIKCSGESPKCKNCLTSNKECSYPQREKKITLLQSQLDILQNRIKYLEKQLEEKTKENDKNVNLLHETKSLISFNKQNFPSSNLNDSNINQINNNIENDNNNNNINTNTIVISSSNNDNTSIPFNSKINHHNANNIYYGISSGQVFDSELKSHLFEINQDTDQLPSNSQSQIPQSRHFFKDPTLELTFSGVVMLPDKDYALSLIDKVIKFLSHEYYLFDAKDFYKQIDEAYEKLKDKKPLWICYFLITLAVGEQYLNYSPNGQIPGMGFYMAAMRLYKSSYEEPTLEFVQTLLLIAFYLQGLNSVNAAFSFYGLAIRSALIQGLHRNIPFIESIEKEKRKRLWWTVFIMDTIWCSNLGHPIHVQIDDIDVDYPEENFINLNDDFNVELLSYNVKLATILGFVMKDIYRPNKGSTSIKVKKVLDCVKQLDNLQNELPPNVKNNLILSDNRSTANFYLRLNQYIIVTTRPLLLSLFKGHVQPTNEIKRVVSRCVKASILNIDILTNLKNNGWLSAFGFWDAQFCFSALIILIICTFAGNIYPQTEMARNINKFMKDKGNFTALDNEYRLKELDDLLSKISKYSKNYSKNDIKMSNSNNISNNYENNGNTKTTTNTPINHILKERTLDTEHQGSSESPKNTSPKNQTPKSKNNSISHIQSNGLSVNNYHEYQQKEGQTRNVKFEQEMNFNDFLSDIEKTFAGPIGDFAPFRNTVSPDTWNELTTNLQFWDPANQ